MHSLTQEHQRGQENRLVQFISVKEPERDVEVECNEKDATGSVPMSCILDAARRANEAALASESRVSCHIAMKELTSFHVGRSCTSSSWQ